MLYEDTVEYCEDYAGFDIPQKEKENVQKLITKIKNKRGLHRRTTS